MGPKPNRCPTEELLSCSRRAMNQHEGRETAKIVHEDDARTREAASAQTVTRPPGAGAEESKQDPYCDEGGES